MTMHTAHTRPRSLTWCILSYTHATITQQTAVDRARSQDENSLRIAHGPHKKKMTSGSKVESRFASNFLVNTAILGTEGIC